MGIQIVSEMRILLSVWVERSEIEVESDVEMFLWAGMGIQVGTRRVRCRVN